jgi:hypothetical protein
MSFSVEFWATVADAEKIVEQEYLPSTVKLFLGQALLAFTAVDMVHVKAFGHLFNKDYERSNAEIVVEKVLLKKPQPPK